LSKNHKVSSIYLVVSIILFLLMYNGFSFDGLTNVIYIWMVLSPIFGIAYAIKGIGWKKWSLIVLNIGTFATILYVLIY
jgi:hypothetical protein